MAGTRIVVTGKGPLVSNPGPSGAAGTAYVILFARRARALGLVRGPGRLSWRSVRRWAGGRGYGSAAGRL